MPDVTPEATPGQAARKAWRGHWDIASERGRGKPGWDSLAYEAEAWEVAAGAAAGYWEDVASELRAELADVRERAKFYEAGRDAAREKLAEAKAALQYWPLCPDGCGCRIGATGPDGENDADARDCACDGPCCMECYENGYPDAPLYRDIARDDAP